MTAGNRIAARPGPWDVSSTFDTSTVLADRHHAVLRGHPRRADAEDERRGRARLAPGADLRSVREIARRTARGADHHLHRCERAARFRDRSTMPAHGAARLPEADRRRSAGAMRGDVFAVG